MLAFFIETPHGVALSPCFLYEKPMAIPKNIVIQLEHEHRLVENIINDMRGAIDQVLREERAPVDLRHTFDEFSAIADDELYGHFDREEQVLFPFLLENFPDAKDAIRRLENGHDRMCGALSRMQRLLAQDEAAIENNFDTIAMLFARFDANFTQHVDQERELLQAMSQRLDEEQLKKLAAMLEEI